MSYFRDFKHPQEEYDAGVGQWCGVMMFRWCNWAVDADMWRGFGSVIVLLVVTLTLPVSIPFFAVLFRYQQRKSLRAQFPNIDKPRGITGRDD